MQPTARPAWRRDPPDPGRLACRMIAWGVRVARGIGARGRGSRGELAVSLDLEEVVEVRVLPFQLAQPARQAVHRQEQEAPAHVLLDVDMLVVAAVVQRGTIDAENDVAERHGTDAAADFLKKP